ncbi:hypothetical protein NDU88_003365 [Pleurodeles waltl]|uniref:Uncharacterized protein n=1 Tax=Pleurodeles waltl TaxID=8319 RepID=A0AAV7RIC6_PLEWA|nr:hypothetical protein NDU88_003365 [Pleurodeles waltl]
MPRFVGHPRPLTALRLSVNKLQEKRSRPHGFCFYQFTRNRRSARIYMCFAVTAWNGLITLHNSCADQKGNPSYVVRRPHRQHWAMGPSDWFGPPPIMARVARSKMDAEPCLTPNVRDTCGVPDDFSQTSPRGFGNPGIGRLIRPVDRCGSDLYTK